MRKLTENPFKAPAFIEERLNIPREIIDLLLRTALKRGGEFAEIYCEYRVVESLLLEDKIIKSASKGIVSGVGIRVISGNKTGFASSTDLSLENMISAAEAAGFIANSGKKNKIKALRSEENLRNLYQISSAPTLDALTDKIKIVRRADEAAYRYNSKIKKSRVNFVATDKVIAIFNSEGLSVRDYQPLVLLNVSTIAEEGGKRGQGYTTWCRRSDMNFFGGNTPERVAKDSARKAIVSLSAEEAPAGTMEVVLGPGETGVLLHEAVGHGLEADAIRKGGSIFAGMIGQRVGSDLVTVIDDGTIPGEWGSINIDDEGVPAQRTVLIEKGMLKGFLYDKLSAKLMKAKTTGSGRRQSFAHPPIPRMRNTFMLGGDSSPKDIIASVKKGIYTADFKGGMVDPVSSQFTFSVGEAYMIENGRIGRPVKGITFIGDCREILKNVVMVGNDVRLSRHGGMCGKDGQSVPVNDGSPTIKLSRIKVGGTKTD